MVNLEWYRTFKAVYQTGSLTAASKALFISQPNVSQHLAALEVHVGKQLFERKPKLLPTDYGKLFYTQVVEPLEKLENVETDFRHRCATPLLPTIHIGAVQEFFHTVLSRNVAKTAAHLLVTFGLTKDLIRQLQKGELDFVIATQQITDPHLTYEPILSEAFILVAHPGLDITPLKNLIRKQAIDKIENWLLAQPWYAYSSDLAIIRRFWLENFKKRPAIRPQFIIADMNTILQAIRYGKGMTITASYLATEMIKAKQLTAVWKGFIPTTNTIYLVYDKTKVTAAQLKAAQELVAIKERG
ncbi:LysR family transcriptional regulator [Chitinophaga nivalis]|uniref:LysR family transcriptional regulator n=1 Tax=Chitinophaga nivalis TaxID=2991709 RepID=A0ABT3IRL1_9BACT|nr:LysR family transcriptional regulator [Chitinophaga nivalis]MCW3463692.1 LysR family transcriptional regulator [Chitinophaga nivalis]MCW3486618.1 LysR family transcriptional regulator [Chitinophaga nivalis]